MNTKFKAVLLLICIASLIGCATAKPFSMMYVTQSLPRGHGELNAGTFTYTPALKGAALPNQIVNTAIGKILLDKDVSEYVKRAFMLEMERSGCYAINPAIHIDAEIGKLQCRDLGFDVDWYFDIDCHFIETATNTELATESVKIVKKGIQKFGGLENFQRQLNGIIYEAYDKIFSSPKVKAFLK